MPAVSKAQQSLMGQAWALRTGQLKLKDIDPRYRKAIKAIADGEMTNKELEKYASTKTKRLPQHVKETFEYDDYQSVEEDSTKSKTQYYKPGDKIRVLNITFPEWYSPAKGFEKLKIGDILTVSDVGQNVDGYVYFTDKDDQYGLTANDILIMHGKFEESSNHIDEKGIPVSGASSPIIGSKSIPNFTPGISVGGGIKPIVPYLNPDATKPKGNRKLQNLADYREYIKKASK
jgi:hypothetical protein